MTTSSDPASHPRRWYGMALLVFVLAVGLRAVFLHEVADDPTSHHLVHDEGVNDQIARAIVDGQMPRVSYYKAPVYMYTLALVYRVLGDDPMRARWAFMFVYGLTPVLLMLLARHLFGTAAGIIAGIVGAVFWTFVFYSGQLVDTSLASLFYVLLAYLMVVLPDSRWFKWPVCGAVLGLGAITRPNILASAPVLALTIVLCGWLREWRTSRDGNASEAAQNRVRRFGRPVLAAAGLTLGCCAAILPVTLRNLIVAGERTLIGTYGGLNFYVANSPWSDGKHGPLIVGEGVPDISPPEPNNLWSRLGLNYRIAKTYAEEQLGRELSMAEVDAFFYALTRRYIRENPRKFLTDYVKRFCWVFNRYEFSNLKDLYRLCDVSRLLSALSWFHCGILCPFAILGIVLAIVTKHRAPGFIYYGAMLAALVFSHALFVLNSRFRVPTMHLLVPLAAYGVVRFVGVWRQRSSRALRIGSCGVLVGAGLFTNLNLFGYANANHLELRMTYPEACLLTKRYDLLRDATEQFERAYFDELDNHGGHPWANELHHATPITWLFFFYHRLSEESHDPADVERALAYGDLMTQREPFNPAAYLTYYEMLIKARRQQRARRMLDVLETHLLSRDPGLVIQYFMLYHSRFADRSVLRRVEELLVSLANQGRVPVRYQTLLPKVRTMLETTGPESQPSSAPASGPASRGAIRR